MSMKPSRWSDTNQLSSTDFDSMADQASSLPRKLDKTNWKLIRRNAVTLAKAVFSVGASSGIGHAALMGAAYAAKTGNVIAGGLALIGSGLAYRAAKLDVDTGRRRMGLIGQNKSTQKAYSGMMWGTVALSAVFAAGALYKGNQWVNSIEAEEKAKVTSTVRGMAGPGQEFSDKAIRAEPVAAPAQRPASKAAPRYSQ